MGTRANPNGRPRRHTSLVFPPLVTPYGKTHNLFGLQTTDSNRSAQHDSLFRVLISDVALVRQSDQYGERSDAA